MIVGIGVDIVKTSRIAEMLEKHGDHFTGRIFTEGELAYAEARKRRVEHLAARFAAKEAVAKALGRGMSDGIVWCDIEVVNTATGKPEIRLSGQVASMAREMGIAALHLSLSHADEYAVATVIAEGPGS